MACFKPCELARSSEEPSCEYRAAKLNRTEARSYAKLGKLVGKAFGLKAGAYEISRPIYEDVQSLRQTVIISSTDINGEFGQDIQQLCVIAERAQTLVKIISDLTHLTDSKARSICTTPPTLFCRVISHRLTSHLNASGCMSAYRDKIYSRTALRMSGM